MALSSYSFCSGYDQHIREVQSRWQEEKIALERRWQQEKETTEERFQELMDDAQMGWRKEKVCVGVRGCRGCGRCQHVSDGLTDTGA
jgi:K+-transporting ATPase c subunit